MVHQCGAPKDVDDPLVLVQTHLMVEDMPRPADGLSVVRDQRPAVGQDVVDVKVALREGEEMKGKATFSAAARRKGPHVDGHYGGRGPHSSDFFIFSVGAKVNEFSHRLT